jgi:hypothetical protein
VDLPASGRGFVITERFRLAIISPGATRVAHPALHFDNLVFNHQKRKHGGAIPVPRVNVCRAGERVA